MTKDDDCIFEEGFIILEEWTGDGWVEFIGMSAPLIIIIADLAQLGERQTEDLKVPGSIPGRGTFSWQRGRVVKAVD